MAQKEHQYLALETWRERREDNKSRKISSEALINAWLREKIQEQTYMRESEKRAAEQLKTFLEKNGHTVSFEAGPNPPDIVFHVDNSKWAVEHTQLHQYVDSSGDELSRLSVDSATLAIEGRLLQKTKKHRKSNWALAVKGQLNSKELRTIEKAAEDAIINDDLRCFKNIPKRQAELLQSPGKDKTIRVFSMLSGSSQIPNSDRLTADIQAHIDYAIKRILKEKAPRLKTLTNYDKRVLLIESQYIFARQDNVTQSIQSHSALADSIDLVYLVISESVSMVWIRAKG